VVQVIANFRDTGLQAFFEHDKPSARIPADIRDRLFRKLQLIDDAISDADLRVPPSNHFEKLSGRSSIRVNAQWRLIFQWESASGKAFNLYLDNHTYR
jgi:proteic killer suppression protein